MWTLTKLPEFNRAYRAANTTWTPAEAAASLQFPMGLMVAVGLATPFWTAVGLFIHHFTK
jgi:uncharacterized membrane protein YphA (DoxX/SURF4 family)